MKFPDHKNWIVTLLFFLIVFSGLSVNAQSKKKSLADKITESSGGNVKVDIPENLTEILLFSNINTEMPTLKPGVNKLAGYRIQVFSDGRNQTTLESRAKARGNLILNRFPKYKGQIYTYSSSPNWFTRVGNFRTNAEAVAALKELKSAFPEFSSEMRIVKSQIVIVK